MMTTQKLFTPATPRKKKYKNKEDEASFSSIDDAIHRKKKKKKKNRFSTRITPKPPKKNREQSIFDNFHTDTLAEEEQRNINNRYKQNFLFFKQRDIEREFLRYYYGKHLIRIRIGTIISVGSWILLLINEALTYSKEKTQTNLIFFLMRLIAIIPGIAIGILFYVPPIMKRPIIIEILTLIYTLFFMLSVCVKFIWLFSGPNGVTSIGTTCIFLIRMRFMNNLIIAIFSTIMFACFTFPGSGKDMLNSSSVPYLSTFYIFSILLVSSLCVFLIEKYIRQLFVVNARIAATKKKVDLEVQRSQKILENILPASFVEQAKISPYGFMQEHNKLCVLFSDLVSFTSISSTISAAKLFRILNRHFSAFDELAEQLALEKVKTIGDAYFCIGFEYNHGPERCVFMSHLMIKKLQELNDEYQENFQIRIGIAQGPSTLCVMGNLKITFDGFGKSVTEAQEMESTSEPNRVHVNEDIKELTKHIFKFEKRFEPHDTYFLQGPIEKALTIDAFQNILWSHDDSSHSQKSRNSLTLTSNSLSSLPEQYAVLERAYVEPKFVQLPPMISRNNLQHFLKDAYSSFIHIKKNNTDAKSAMKYIDQFDTDRYAAFIQSSHDQVDEVIQDEKTLKKYPKFNRLTTLFHSKDLLKEFLLSSYDKQQYILIGLGFVVTIVYFTSTLFSYNTVYFESLPFSYMTTFGIVEATCILLNLLFTILYAIPCFHRFYIVGLAYSLIFTVNLIVYIIAYGLHNQEKPLVWVYRPFFYCATSVYLFFPTIPFLLKIVVFFTCMIIPSFIFNILTLGVNVTVLIESVANFLMQILVAYILHFVIAKIFERRKKMASQVAELEYKSKRNHALLHSSLPPHIVERMNENIKSKLKQLQRHASLSVLTKDKKNIQDVQIYDDISSTNVMFVKFYGLGDLEQSKIGIHFLNDIFSWFDLIADELHLLKIKSIGTTYIAMCQNAKDVAKCALAFLHITKHIIPIYEKSFIDYAKQLAIFKASEVEAVINSDDEGSYCSDVPIDHLEIPKVSVKLGIHTGPVSAGILGVSKFLYDIFGDTVNVSSRMCTLSDNNCIQLTKTFVNQLNDSSFFIQPRGLIDVKGKGSMQTYFLYGYDSDF